MDTLAILDPPELAALHRRAMAVQGMELRDFEEIFVPTLQLSESEGIPAEKRAPGWWAFRRRATLRNGKQYTYAQLLCPTSVEDMGETLTAVIAVADLAFRRAYVLAGLADHE
jgi:hypothetical protein